MKRKFLFISFSIFILLKFSCGNAPDSSGSNSSIPLANLNLKNYVGSASIGDIIWYGVDNTTKTLQFSNITRGYAWQATFTEQDDGTKMMAQ